MAIGSLAAFVTGSTDERHCHRQQGISTQKRTVSDPAAMFEKLLRPALVKRPLPSEIFTAMGSLARWSWFTRGLHPPASCFGAEQRRSASQSHSDGRAPFHTKTPTRSPPEGSEKGAVDRVERCNRGSGDRF